MKRTIVIFIASLIFLSVNNVSYAQTDSLKVYHLIAFPEYEDLSIVNIDSMPIEPKEIKINILFKLNYPDNALKIFIKLGTTRDVSDIRFDTINVIKQGEDYYLQDNNENYKILYHSATYKYILSIQEYEKLTWITVYSEDKNGVITSKQYFNYK